MVTPPTPPVSRPVLEALERSRALGFLGPGPLDLQVDHALGFGDTTEAHLPPGTAAGPILDLGSGGGLPGLVLAERWPDAALTLLDANERRTAFLLDTVAALGWGDRVVVVRQRAETAGRMAALRGAFGLVVARSFGPPAVTAECAAPFLRVGGLLVVSEPPGVTRDDDGPLRWPTDGLRLVGLAPIGEWRGRFGYQVVRQEVPCPEAYPRTRRDPSQAPPLPPSGILTGPLRATFHGKHPERRGQDAWVPEQLRGQNDSRETAEVGRKVLTPGSRMGRMGGREPEPLQALTCASACEAATAAPTRGNARLTPRRAPKSPRS